MSEQESVSENNWKTKVIIASTVLGAFAGLAAGYLLSRTAEESSGEPPKIDTMDALKVAIGAIGIVRGIAALGDKN